MKKQTITSYEEALEYLFAIPRFPEAVSGKLPRKNSIEDTQAFLQKLGDPDKQMHIIHVAGTNGKGSVCAYMRSILEQAGKRVCVFTSPHLVEVTERFYICGQDASEEAFLQAFLTVYEALDWNALERGEGYHPSFFEYLFFMAMLLFAEAKPDYCILETGLGGRLDATNSVRKKELCVITSISLDHMEYLGETVEEIAAEKAGIMQKGVMTVALDREEGVSQVFVKKAKESGNALYFVSKMDALSLKKGNKTIDFSISTDYYNDIRVTLGTQALYQVENCLLAIKAIELLDKNTEITKQDICLGVKNCFWQGRMEEVTEGVFVDGAHNEDGVRAFLETVSEDGWNGKRTVLISIVKDKEYRNIFGKVAKSGLFSKVIAVPLQSARTLSEDELMQCLTESIGTDTNRIQYKTKTGVVEALDELLQTKTDEERLYIAGSLYLAGEVKAYLRERNI